MDFISLRKPEISGLFGPAKTTRVHHSLDGDQSAFAKYISIFKRSCENLTNVPKIQYFQNNFQLPIHKNDVYSNLSTFSKKSQKNTKTEGYYFWFIRTYYNCV